MTRVNQALRTFQQWVKCAQLITTAFVGDGGVDLPTVIAAAKGGCNDHFNEGIEMGHSFNRDRSPGGCLRIPDSIFSETGEGSDKFAKILMQIRSDKTRESKFREWTIDPGNFMETSYEMHPIDKEDHRGRTPAKDLRLSGRGRGHLI
jgi:hypothetical protein